MYLNSNDKPSLTIRFATPSTSTWCRGSNSSAYLAWVLTCGSQPTDKSALFFIKVEHQTTNLRGMEDLVGLGGNRLTRINSWCMRESAPPPTALHASTYTTTSLHFTCKNVVKYAIVLKKIALLVAWLRPYLSAPTIVDFIFGLTLMIYNASL